MYLYVLGILNVFYKDKGAGAMFAKLFNDLAETFPEKKLNRLQDLILGKNCLYVYLLKKNCAWSNKHTVYILFICGNVHF